MHDISSGGRYVLKLEILCSQDRAGMYLAYAVADVIRNGARKYGSRGRPRVVDFAHSISSVGTFAVIVFDESAARVYGLVEKDRHSRITSANKNILTASPDPSLAAIVTSASIKTMWNVSQ